MGSEFVHELQGQFVGSFSSVTSGQPSEGGYRVLNFQYLL